MRILLVSIHYPPLLGMSSRGMAELSRALVSFGHSVDVLTTVPTPGHPVYRFNFSEMRHVPPEVNVHRVSIGPINRIAARLLGRTNGSRPRFEQAASKDRLRIRTITRFSERLYDARKFIQPFLIPDAMLDWIPAAVLEARRMLKNASYDVVVSFGYPHSAHCVAYLALSGNQLPWVMMHAEGWGNNPAITTLPRWSRSIHQAIDRRLSRTARRTVFCGWAEGLGRVRLHSDSVEIEKVRVAQFSFVDPAPYESIAVFPTSGLHMVYTGAFYPEHRQDPRELFEAIDLIGSDEIRLSILGDSEKSLHAHVAARHIRNIEFLGWCSPETVVRYQKSARLLVVFGCMGGKLIPSKVYEYFMARVPILCISDDPEDLTAQIISRHNRGVIVSNSRDQIASVLRRLLALQTSNSLAVEFNLDELPQYAPRRSAETLIKSVLDEQYQQRPADRLEVPTLGRVADANTL